MGCFSGAIQSFSSNFKLNLSSRLSKSDDKFSCESPLNEENSKYSLRNIYPFSVVSWSGTNFIGLENILTLC